MTPELLSVFRAWKARDTEIDPEKIKSVHDSFQQAIDTLRAKETPKLSRCLAQFYLRDQYANWRVETDASE